MAHTLTTRTTTPAGFTLPNVATLSLWWARSIQRRQLAKLSAERLDDLGIAAKDAAQEAQKPFWRA